MKQQNFTCNRPHTAHYPLKTAPAPTPVPAPEVLNLYSSYYTLNTSHYTILLCAANSPLHTAHSRKLHELGLQMYPAK